MAFEIQKAWAGLLGLFCGHGRRNWVTVWALWAAAVGCWAGPGNLDTRFLVLPRTDVAPHLIATGEDGAVFVAGRFTQYGGVAHRSVARLGASGELDGRFSARGGAWIRAGAASNAASLNVLVALSEGRVLVGGDFNRFHETACSGVVVLKSDGSVEGEFGVSEPKEGAEAPVVFAAAKYPGERIVVGGRWLEFQGSVLPGLIRLKRDGTVDSSFRDAGLGAPGTARSVHALAVLEDGGMWISATYQNRALPSVAEHHLVRLTADGSVDTGFGDGEGVTGAVAIGLLPERDGVVVLLDRAGKYRGVDVPTVFRVTSAGQLDAEFGKAYLRTTPVGQAVRLSDGRVAVGGLLGVTRLTELGERDATFVAPGFQDGFRFERGFAALEGGDLLVSATFNGLRGVFRLRGNPPADAPPLPPQVRLDPDRRNFVAGENIAFLSLTEIGVTMQWMKDGKELADAARPSYSIFNAQASSSGRYVLRVSNGFGTAESEPFVIDVVTYPLILEQPAAQATTPGGSATFSVVATGTGQLTYQWLRDTVELANATQAQLTLSQVTTNHAGLYRVRVKNAFGEVFTSPARLIVDELQPPTITEEPGDRTALKGEPTNFRVESYAVPLARYQWYFEGAMLSGQTNNILYLSNLSLRDLGRYYAVVQNSMGVVTSRWARLTVVDPPVIVRAPTEQRVEIGEAAVFEVEARNGEPLTYQWFRNGAALSRETNAVMRIPEADVQNEGVYVVEVTGRGGRVASEPVRLTITNKVPAWRSLTAVEWRAETFVVRATAIAGDPPLTAASLVFESTTDWATWLPVAESTVSLASEGRFEIRGAGGATRFYRARLK